MVVLWNDICRGKTVGLRRKPRYHFVDHKSDTDFIGIEVQSP